MPLPTRLQRYCDPVLLVPFFISFIHSFLLFIADMQLYKRLCPLVGHLVRPSAREDVYVSLGGSMGCRWGLDAPAHPATTIL